MATLKLKDVLPQEFFIEFYDTPAAKHLDAKVVETNDSWKKSFPGKHKNVHVWWKLENGLCIGWNENVAVGWSFPIAREKK